MPRKKTMAGAAPYTQPLLPGESIILPTKQLQRVFIGLGWNNIQGVTVDLDCSIVAYTADGTRDEENTVFFGRLRNGVQRSSKTGSSIVHTGDILKGKEGNAAVEDMERIYVYLSELPEHLATVAFAADVFTTGLSFSSLSNAYVRIVNADTNQELARLTLTSAYLGPMAESRVVLLARLRRLTNGGAEALWLLESTAEPKEKTLRELAGPLLDMAAVTIATGIPIAQAVQPIAPVMAQPVVPISTTGTVVPEPPMGLPPTQQGGAATAKRARGRVFVCPALAVGTAAGVAAAAAVFFSSNLSPSMLESDIFTSGVDFSLLEMPDVSGAGAFFEEGLAATGGVLEGGMEMATEGASFCGGLCGDLCSSDKVQDAQVMASVAAEQVTTMASGAAEQVSTLAGEGLAAATILVGEGLAKAGEVVSTAGEAATKVGDAATKVVEQAVEIVGAIAGLESSD